MSATLGLASVIGVGYFFVIFLSSMFVAETERSVGFNADSNRRIFTECLFAALAFTAFIWGMLAWWAHS